MPPPIVPAPITPTLRMVLVGTSGADVGDLGRRPLGEEHVALRLGLGRGEQRHEHLALFRHAFVERQVDRVLHRLDRFQPGLEAAEFSRVRLADRLENLRMAARRLELVEAVAHFLERRLLGDQPPREGERGFVQFAFLGELVDDAPFLRLARAEGRAGENDVERLLDADEARQPLRAAGAGNEAELDFRQAAFRRGDGDAVMGGQRHLEPAAERRPVQRGDDRLRGVLDRIEHVREIGRGRRLAEFGNVGAGDEGAPGADEDDRLDGRVGLGRLDAPLQAVADGLRERVDRRRVDGDRRHVSVDGEIGDRIDGRHLISSLKRSRAMLMPFAGPAQRGDASPLRSRGRTCNGERARFEEGKGRAADRRRPRSRIRETVHDRVFHAAPWSFGAGACRPRRAGRRLDVRLDRRGGAQGSRRPRSTSRPRAAIPRSPWSPADVSGASRACSSMSTGSGARFPATTAAPRRPRITR